MGESSIKKEGHIQQFVGRPIPITEKSIEVYGEKDLCHWVFMKSRARNGVVYQHFGPTRKALFGWGKSKFYKIMSELVRAGLATKDKHNNWLLTNPDVVIGLNKGGKKVRHKCTIVVDPCADEYEVRDFIIFKLAERRHRQISWALLPPKSTNPKILAKRERVLLREKAVAEQFGHSRAETWKMGSMGTSHQDQVNFAEKGLIAMNTDTLMKATGLGRWRFFAWKKRVMYREWMTQHKRSTEIPPDIAVHIPYSMRDIERNFQGKVIPGHIPKFVQASLYSMNITYSIP